MKTPQRILAILLLSAVAQSASAVSIVFDYSYDTTGFFTDAARKNTLNQAGAYLGNRLQDNLTAISSGGGNNFTAKFFNPSDPNTASSDVSLSNSSVAANVIRVYVGASNLGGTTLGIGGPGGSAVSGTTQDFLDNASARGQTGALATTPTDFGPWGGALGFNSINTTWYFDQNTSNVEAFNGFDFFSVAVHELGHLLGVGTADSWKNQISSTNFNGAFSSAVHGGPVPLADGGHWAVGTMGIYNGNSQEAAMGPNIAAGQRNYFTDLDFAALQDIGWEVSPAPAPVPLPGALVLLFSGLSLMFAWGKRSALV